MGSPERRVRAKEALRKKIMDAARDLFVREGVGAITMRKIAHAIEYSPTAIYLHFQDKETLIRELCVQDFEAMFQRFQKAAAPGDPIERLRAIGRAYWKFAVAYPNHYRFMFMTPHPHPHPTLHPDRDSYAFLVATVREGLGRGCFAPDLGDADRLAQLCWGSLHGVIALHLTKSAHGPDGSAPDDDATDIPWAPLEEICEQAQTILLRGILAR